MPRTSPPAPYLPRGIIRWLWLPLNAGGIRGTHFLNLCFLNQSIASLGHAGTRRSIRGASVRIGGTKGDGSLFSLKEWRGISYFSTVCSDPGHFRSDIRCYATGKHIEQGDRTR